MGREVGLGREARRENDVERDRKKWRPTPWRCRVALKTQLAIPIRNSVKHWYKSIMLDLHVD